MCHSLQFLQAGNTSCSKGRYDDPKSPELLVTHPPFGIESGALSLLN